MSSAEFISAFSSPMTPYRGTLASFGSAADGKVVKKTGFTLQGTTDGAAWTTLASDTYFVNKVAGYVEKNIVDDSGTEVDWSSYTDYQDLGNQAFRVTYTVKNGSTSTTYTNEAITFADDEYYDPATAEGGVNAGNIQDLYVYEIHAEIGDIGGWTISATQITSDSGNVFLDSSVPSIGVGATGYQTGTGFWVGKSSGSYKLYIGDSTNKQMYWDGSALTAGGFTIGADYLRDTGNSFGLASTVTGGDDVRFWAGDTFANRATAPYQVYESGYIFAKDIVLAKANLSGASGGNGYGYAVNPLLMCHFDGGKPYETDFGGSIIGHLGQAGTYKHSSTEGRGIFREGKFGKAVQIAEATTNLITNPSFEGSAGAGSTTGWSQQSTPTTFAASQEQAKFGTWSLKLASTSTLKGATISISCSSNTAYTISLYALVTVGSANLQVNGNVSGALSQTNDCGAADSTWRRVVTTVTTGASDTTLTLYIVSTTATSTWYIDGVQIEQRAYVTPYLDGGLGGSTNTTVVNGHSWSSTASASTSSRTAETLTYPASGNVSLTQGSASLWTYINPTHTTNCKLFGVYIDSSNFLDIYINNSLKIIGESKSGGSTVDTSSGATALAVGWHHVVMTWTSGSLKLYVDGAQNGATASYTTPAGTASTLEVGSMNLTQLADTLIDDLAILPIVLTDHEIKSIYYSDAPLMLAVSTKDLHLAGSGGGEVFGNANGLFGRNANGTASFGLLNGTVNATTWGGASESFDTGDFMFGSNASGKNNLIFDSSAGLFALRTATTRKFSVDTNGTLLLGSDTTNNTLNTIGVFSGGVTYNGETMAAGYMLFGDNSNANMLYDTVSFRVRIGTTNYVSLDSVGVTMGGGTSGAGWSSGFLGVSGLSGTVDLDANGSGTGVTIDGNCIRCASTGAWTLQDIVAGRDGQFLIVINSSANNMTIKNNTGGVAPFAKIRTFSGDLTTTGIASASFVYNNNNGTWDLVSYNA